MKVTTRIWARSMLGLAASAALMGTAWAQETLKIGVLATLEGPFAVPGQDSMRGADLALKQKNGTLSSSASTITAPSSGAAVIPLRKRSID